MLSLLYIMVGISTLAHVELKGKNSGQKVRDGGEGQTLDVESVRRV